MSIFVYPDNPMLFYYFFVPSGPLAETQKQSFPELETPNSPGAENLKSIL